MRLRLRVLLRDAPHGRPDPGPARRHPRQPRGRAAGVPVRRGAAAAPRPARDHRHVLRLHHRAADQRHPRPGHGAASWRARSPSSTSASTGRGRRSPGSAATTTRSWPASARSSRRDCRSRCRRSCSAPPSTGLPYLCQIADVLDAGKLKLILPLRKGNALGLAEREFITVEEARDAFGRLTELRGIHDWRPAVRMTPWTAETEGHMIVDRAERQRPGLAGLRSARPVPAARQPAGGTHHRDLGPLPVQGQPLRQVPRGQHLHRRPQPPRDANLDQPGLAR